MLPPFLLLRSLNRSGNRKSKILYLSWFHKQEQRTNKRMFFWLWASRSELVCSPRQHSCQQLKKTHKTLKNMSYGSRFLQNLMWYRSLFLKYGSLFANRESLIVTLVISPKSNDFAREDCKALTCFVILWDICVLICKHWCSISNLLELWRKAAFNFLSKLKLCVEREHVQAMKFGSNDHFVYAVLESRKRYFVYPA